jgi:superfamily I DNA/RNA helicase
MSEENNKICEAERKKYTSAIINSTDKKRIVAAGPGTGKTFLFKKICQKSDGKKIVLSFINELVDDLKKELEKIAEVKTLHGFARSKLNCKFFIKLTDLIEEDFVLINKKNANFKEIFELLEEKDEELKFYSERRKYYDYVGPHCSVYALIKYFEQTPSKVPKYSQILVDEFQDFNKLEIKLIDILAENSPILIAGDDDQSLYSFKKAEPKEIQQRYENNDYESFQLPYCSRCTKVLVETANDLIKKSKQKNYLNERIEKDYKYFSSDEKDEISKNNPKIILQNSVYQRQTAYKITENIKNILKVDDDFEVLIICPYKKDIKKLKIDLNKKGFRNIRTPDDNNNEFSKKEAYKILLEDEKSNLGWRILINFILEKEKIKDVIKESIESGTAIIDLVDQKNKKMVTKTLRTLKKIKKDKEINEKDLDILIDNLDYNLFEIIKRTVKEDMTDEFISKNCLNEIPIRIVTMPGSKGLSSDYVFMINFDDRFIIDKERGLDDETIRKFLVVLTRARKRLTIISSGGKIPTLVSWLDRNLYKISN